MKPIAMVLTVWRDVAALWLLLPDRRVAVAAPAALVDEAVSVTRPVPVRAGV